VIGNVYRGDGARGLLDYLSGKEGAMLLSTNLDGESPQAFARQIGEVRLLHPKEQLARPVCHIPLRPAPGEDLTDEEWEDVLQHTLERMGFANSPYVAYLHDHGDGRHLHIATYRVTFEGRLVSDSNDRFRVMAVAREIEEQFGLTVATQKRPVSLTRPALERLLRDPERAGVMASLRLAIDQAASDSDTLRGFLTGLNRLGVKADLKISRNAGNIQGFTLTLPDGSTLKGSDLGKKYSLAKICSRHEFRLDLKPEGPVLVVTDVSDREYKRLQSEGLEADHAARYGSRRTLYWQLPPGEERAFSDLIALRLPHRFLTTADELPVAPPSPSALEDRARRVRLLAEIEELGPSLAPPLPANVSASEKPERPRSQPGLAERAQQCQALSAALMRENALPADAAARRAEYHHMMIEALSAIESVSPGRPQDSAAKIPSAEFSVFQPQAALPFASERLPIAAAEPEIPPAESLNPTPDSQLTAIERLRERALVAAARYEKEGTTESFHRWAHLEQRVRLAEKALPRREPASTEALRSAVATLGTDLLEAHDRYTADPTEVNRREWKSRQKAYETLARRLDNLASKPLESIEPGRDRPETSTLATDLLDAQDRYFADPNPVTEATWRKARYVYERRIASEPPSRTQPPPAPIDEARRLRIDRDALVSRLRTAERAFIDRPSDPLARATWRDALQAVEGIEARLAAAETAALGVYQREQRQTAATLAFYEEAHFRSPSALTARLWKQAEQAHLRASLTYERARLRLEAQPAPEPSRPVPRKSTALGEASTSIARIFEKQLLGQPDRAQSLARRAASRWWARTDLGRAFVQAASPLRTVIAALSGGSVVGTAVGASSETIRRSLVIYIELRAARDRIRQHQVPQARRQLEQGDFSNRALATAVVRARSTEPETLSTLSATAAPSLPAAIRASRTAEARLLRSYRSFRRGLASHHDLAKSAALALSARAAVTERLHNALGLPSLRDFTAVLGTREGRSTSAWMGTLTRAGLSARAIASGVIESAPLVLASAGAAVAIVSARQLVRAAVAYLRLNAREITCEQQEHRR
jgi:hypothetical protein